MPQLMPLNWCMSFLMVGLLCVMMSVIYFSCGENYEFFMKEGRKITLNWEW